MLLLGQSRRLIMMVPISTLLILVIAARYSFEALAGN